MPIGSMTKAMTAAMIGELVAEGKLDWDKTPVVEYVPEARFNPILSEELTLSDYLSHRSVRLGFRKIVNWPSWESIVTQLNSHFFFLIRVMNRVFLTMIPLGPTRPRPELKSSVDSST